MRKLEILIGKIIIFIVKCAIAFGLIYGILYVLGAILTWGENHIGWALMTTTPVLMKLFYNELKNF